MMGVLYSKRDGTKGDDVDQVPSSQSREAVGTPVNTATSVIRRFSRLSLCTYSGDSTNVDTINCNNPLPSALLPPLPLMPSGELSISFLILLSVNVSGVVKEAGDK